MLETQCVVTTNVHMHQHVRLYICDLHGDLTMTCRVMRDLVGGYWVPGQVIGLWSTCRAARRGPRCKDQVEHAHAHVMRHRMGGAKN